MNTAFSHTPPSWLVEMANAWYAQQPFSEGASFAHSDAIYQIEMWQRDSFNSADKN